MFKKLTPSITANDLQASQDFYQKALGFEILDSYEQDGKVVGLHLHTAGADLFLSQDDFAKGHDREKGVGMRFYISCDDVDAAAKRVDDTGVDFFQPLADQPWGSRDFAVKDPDGFVISVGTEADVN